MADELSCYRCGASLAKLTLPLSQRDECPDCSVHLHVCRMCVFFDAGVPKQCREDDAEEVPDKEKMNFCEWFKPTADAFDPKRAGEAARATSELAALFGEEPGQKADTDELTEAAEDLFK
mgnify:FL=1|jgi:hypothetical protein